MKCILTLAVLISLGVHAMEDQAVVSHSQTMVLKGGPLCRADDPDNFTKRLHTSLASMQETIGVLYWLSALAIDPTLTTAKLEELAKAYKEVSQKVQNEMSCTSFGGHLLFQSTWWLGGSLLSTEPEICLDTGAWQFITSNPAIEGVNNPLVSLAGQVRQLRAKPEGRATFFHFDKEGKVGFSVFPGQGIRLTLSEWDPCVPFLLDTNKASDVHATLKQAMNRVSSVIFMAACLSVATIPPRSKL